MSPVFRFYIFVLLIAFSLSACGFIKRPYFLQAKPASLANVSVEVFSPEDWQQGGGLIMVPFTPGMRVEAGGAKDRIALMIVKGCADTLDKNFGKRFQYEYDVPELAQYVLEGHVEDVTLPRWWKRSFLSRKRGIITITAEMRSMSTNALVAKVRGYQTFRRFSEIDQAAYELGIALGEITGK